METELSLCLCTQNWTQMTIYNADPLLTRYLWSVLVWVKFLEIGSIEKKSAREISRLVDPESNPLTDQPA